ncbi:MAG: MlaD family protein [Synechococcaceae cyanobacterium]|nr:MlaD family protein [Synechococcaceae cyanobacterium]
MTAPDGLDAEAATAAKERWLFLGSGLVLVAALLFALGREHHWGERMVPLYLTSRHAGGLRPGQEVRISGLPVGQITSLQLEPDASVLVRLQVAKRYASLIGPKSAASQSQEGFVGNHFLEISPDPQPAGADSALKGRGIRYEQPVALPTLMRQLLRTQQDLQATLRHTRQLTANDLPDTLREMRRSLGGVSRLTGTLRQEAMATGPELRSSLRDTRRSLSGVNHLTRTLQRETAATAPDLRLSLRQLSRTGASAEATSNDVQQLLKETRRLLRLLAGLFGAEAAGPP